jgi:hypothetical protein
MWLLAIVEDTPVVPTGVRTVTDAGLTAVVDVAGSHPATTDQLLAHAGLVASLLQHCDAVLPVRAGTRVDGEEGVRRLLRERADEFRRGLDRVRGRVELAVRCDREPSAGEQRVTDGRAYLESRTRAWRWADGTRDLLSRFALLPDVWEVAVLRHGPTSVSGSLLVSAAAAGRVMDDVLQAGPEAAGAMRCSGPYPPYSFCAQPEAVTR